MVGFTDSKPAIRKPDRLTPVATSFHGFTVAGSIYHFVSTFCDLSRCTKGSCLVLWNSSNFQKRRFIVFTVEFAYAIWKPILKAFVSLGDLFEFAPLPITPHSPYPVISLEFKGVNFIS